eukprot:gb/GECG01007652.1/.p1 GENE.gb/GECG01007652.1/~~gb/GECG01007652.1/.p1  ORF type:complete len:367 (+),score=34.51 gb/GECG01007652.1/:1-1101(+)
MGLRCILRGQTRNSWCIGRARNIQHGHGTTRNWSTWNPDDFETQFLRNRFGEFAKELHKVRGLIHPCLMWQSRGDIEHGKNHQHLESEAPLQSILIGPDSPKQEEDLFMLYLTRALTDSVLTSSKNIRSEPGLTVSLAADAAKWNRSLREWRKTRCRSLHSDPVAVVITSGRRQIDFTQPFFQEWFENPETSEFRPLLLAPDSMTGSISAEYHLQSGNKALVTSDADHLASEEERTRKRCLRERRLEIVGSKLLNSPDAGPVHGFNAACAYLKKQGYQTTSIEAGLSTCGHLYRPGGRMVDYLFLSRYGGPSPSPSVVGKTFVSPGYLSRCGFRSCGGYNALSVDGSLWAFDILRLDEKAMETYQV